MPGRPDLKISGFLELQMDQSLQLHCLATLCRGVDSADDLQIT